MFLEQGLILHRTILTAAVGVMDQFSHRATDRQGFAKRRYRQSRSYARTWVTTAQKNVRRAEHAE